MDRKPKIEWWRWAVLALFVICTTWLVKNVEDVGAHFFGGLLIILAIYLILTVGRKPNRPPDAP